MLSFQQQTENDTSNGNSNGNATGNVWERVLVVGDVRDVQKGDGGTEDNSGLRMQVNKN